jgi:flagellar basal-body rod modification protein FlgD
MSTTAIQATSSGTSSTDLSSQSKAVEGNQMDKNDFLTLFLTQLKYQDPSNPMESYEMAAQLAQFSSVEQLTQVNSNLLKLQSSVASSTNAQLMNLIGKEVTGTTSTIQWKDGQASTISYQLDSPAEVDIYVSDSNGNLIRTIKMTGQAAGSHDFQWDGKNDSGQTAAAGDYTCSIQSVDSSGITTDLTGTIRGQVYSFRLEGGSPYLIMNGQNGIRLPVGNILEVTDTSEGG